MPLLFTRIWEVKLDPPDRDDIFSGMSPFLLSTRPPAAATEIARANQEWNLLMSAAVAPNMATYHAMVSAAGMPPICSALTFLETLEAQVVWRVTLLSDTHALTQGTHLIFQEHHTMDSMLKHLLSTTTGYPYDVLRIIQLIQNAYFRTMEAS